MELQKKILEIVKAMGIPVTDWLISENGRIYKPPYACVSDVDGHGIYADGKIVIPIETVRVQLVYTPDDDITVSKIKTALEPYGYEWQKEKFGAERVMIMTLTVEGGPIN